MTETLALQDALRESLDAELDAIVVNALEPDRFTPADARAAGRAPGRTRVSSGRSPRTHARAASARSSRVSRGPPATDRCGCTPRRSPTPDLAALADELAGQLT